MPVPVEGRRYLTVARAALAVRQIPPDTAHELSPTVAVLESKHAPDDEDGRQPRVGGKEQGYLVRARAALATVEVQECAVGAPQSPAPAVSSEAACDPEGDRHEDVVTRVDTRSTGDGTTTGNPTATRMAVQADGQPGGRSNSERSEESERSPSIPTNADPFISATASSVIVAGTEAVDPTVGMKAVQAVEQPSGRTGGEKSEESEKSPSIPAHARTVTTVVADPVISATASSAIVAGTEAVDPTVRTTVVQAIEQPGGRSNSEESEESPSLPAARPSSRREG